MILSDVLTYKQQQQQNMWFCEMYLLTNRREKNMILWDVLTYKQKNNNMSLWDT